MLGLVAWPGCRRPSAEAAPFDFQDLCECHFEQVCVRMSYVLIDIERALHVVTIGMPSIHLPQGAGNLHVFSLGLAMRVVLSALSVRPGAGVCKIL